MTIDSRRAGPTLAGVAGSWLPVLIWTAVILSISGNADLGRQPNPATGEPVRTTFAIAKAAHLVEYGILGALLFRALTAPGGGITLPPGRAAAWAVALAVAIGCGDEARQSFVPAREPRLTDVAIDGLGAALATLALAYLTGWRPGSAVAGASAERG